MTRVGVGGIWHETNTYAARPTVLSDFGAFELDEGEAILARHAGTGSVIGGMLAEGGFDPVPLATAGAWPSGRVEAGTLQAIFSRFGKAARRVGRLDGLLCNLHGAMVAEGEDDVEAAFLGLCREVVGDAPLVVVCDLHGNPSVEMAARAEAVVVYDTYPHVDMEERGREAARILSELAEGARYRTTVRKVPVLICPLAQATDAEPMATLEARAREAEEDPGIRRVALFPGFPYSDVARAGFSVVVTHEERAERSAGEVAGELAAMVADHDWTVTRPEPAAAVAEAMAAGEGPVVLADVADNVGGGSPGDGTALLAELLARGAEGAVVTLADAEAAGQAARAGVGSVVEMQVGGKTDRLHGDPVAVRGEVASVTDGRYRTEGTWMTGQVFSMGTTTVIGVEGVTLMLTERPTPPFHREHLTSQGIDPAEATIIVAKGAIAWRSAYGDVARRVIEVDTPGICPVDPYVLPRTTVPQAVL